MLIFMFVVILFLMVRTGGVTFTSFEDCGLGFCLLFVHTVSSMLESCTSLLLVLVLW